MEWAAIVINMRDDRGEAAQKGLSFKHHLPLDLRALAPPEDLRDMLEWNPVVRPVASYQTYSDYNIVASAVKVSNKGCCHTVSWCIWRQVNVIHLRMTVKTLPMNSWKKGLSIRIVTVKDYKSCNST